MTKTARARGGDAEYETVSAVPPSTSHSTQPLLTSMNLCNYHTLSLSYSFVGPPVSVFFTWLSSLCVAIVVCELCEGFVYNYSENSH